MTKKNLQYVKNQSLIPPSMYQTRDLQLVLLGSVLLDKRLKGLYCPLPAELLDLLPVLIEVKCREAINLNA